MSSIKLVIFDWDGTLFDSAGQIVDSLQFAAQQHQQSLTAEDAAHIIGLGLPEVMQTLFPRVPELHDAILESYATHYVAHSSHDQWFVGVHEMLHDLKQQGIILAVATGKSRRGLDRVLTTTASHDLFTVTRAASETKSKPHPLMLEEILQHTGIDVNHAVMVGDTTYDLEMAQRIGMKRIGVSYGVHAVEELMSYEPIYIAQSLIDLHDYLIQHVQTKR